MSESPYMLVAVLGALALFQGGLCASQSYYTAGVVEFRPTLTGLSSADLLDEHLTAYLEIIHSSDANATDILVFPEGTLNNAFQLTYVPAGPDDNPCLDATHNAGSKRNDEDPMVVADFLRRLSCAARDTRKYLLINLTEKAKCLDPADDPRPCAADGLNVFNTNVVFDREGRIISRYRKWNIYVEAKNTTPEVEYGIFETDFGVRFGHFVCFDMLFWQPAEELVQRHGIRNIIFPSMFYSELPFLTGTQLQKSWSWGNNVNLLAAGASYPKAGMTGSGIYAGQLGALISVMAKKEGVRILLVTRVPKNPAELSKEDVRNLRSINAVNDLRSINQTSRSFSEADIKMLRDPILDEFESSLLDTSNLGVEKNTFLQTCDGSFCCTFNLTLSPVAQDPTPLATFYTYRLGMFNGSRSYQKDELSYVQICSLYACLNSSLSSCGLLFDENTIIEENFIFSSIRIEGRFAKADKLLIMPTTLTDRLNSFNSDEIQWRLEDEGDFHKAYIELQKPAANLLTFGIYANYYDRTTDNALKLTSRGFMVLLCCVIISIFYLKFENF